MAYVIPVQSRPDGARGPQLLIVILTGENLGRMRQGDPFDIELAAYAHQMNVERSLKTLDIVIAYEEDEEELERLAALGGLAAIIRWIERGRKHRPGDARPPVSVKGPQ